MSSTMICTIKKIPYIHPILLNNTHKTGELLNDLQLSIHRPHTLIINMVSPDNALSTLSGLVLSAPQNHLPLTLYLCVHTKQLLAY